MACEPGYVFIDYGYGLDEIPGRSWVMYVKRVLGEYYCVRYLFVMINLPNPILGFDCISSESAPRERQKTATDVHLQLYLWAKLQVLRYAGPFWAKMHPSELRCPLLS